jgi:hypothetical protein
MISGVYLWKVVSALFPKLALTFGLKVLDGMLEAGSVNTYNSWASMEFIKSNMQRMKNIFLIETKKPPAKQEAGKL